MVRVGLQKCCKTWFDIFFEPVRYPNPVITSRGLKNVNIEERGQARGIAIGIVASFCPCYHSRCVTSLVQHLASSERATW